MKLPALIFLLFFSSPLFAQGSWQIILNKKLLISSSVSDEAINKKVVKSSDWKSASGYLDIRYKAEGNMWKYTLQLTDEAGNELWKIDTCSIKIKLTTLRRLYAGKKELKLILFINPSNPMMSAPSRLVHLGTLKLP